VALMADVVVEQAGRPLRRRAARRLRPFAFLFGPIGILLAFFVAPLIIMVVISFRYASLFGFESGWTISNYVNVLSDPIYWDVAKDTVQMATIAMGVQLLIGFPLAYWIAFKAGRFELVYLLLLVLADELNPIIRIYAWRMILGREGMINHVLQSVGVIDHPLDWLLFTKFSVILVLTTSWVTYTVLPIYAAMKAIDPSLFEAAIDLGASWTTRWRRILIPLAAPGIFVAVILVYIPLFTDFATPALVGGASSYMLGNSVADLMIATGDWGMGSALSLLLLVAVGGVAVIAYFLSKLNQLD
jgi:spermidine/putrescine transport system permease protein